MVTAIDNLNRSSLKLYLQQKTVNDYTSEAVVNLIKYINYMIQDYTRESKNNIWKKYWENYSNILKERENKQKFKIKWK